MREINRERAAFGRLIIGAARSWRRLADQALVAHGFSEAMALPLLVLLHNDHGMRQCEIADALHLERPALVRIVDLLVGEGCVIRAEDSKDRRAKILNLTVAGRAKALEVEKIMDRLRRRILAGVTDGDLIAASRALLLIEGNLRGLVAEKALDE